MNMNHCEPKTEQCFSPAIFNNWEPSSFAPRQLLGLHTHKATCRLLWRNHLVYTPDNNPVRLVNHRVLQRGQINHGRLLRGMSHRGSYHGDGNIMVSCDRLPCVPRPVGRQRQVYIGSSGKCLEFAVMVAQRCLVLAVCLFGIT